MGGCPGLGGGCAAMSTWGWCECTWWEGDPGMVGSGSFMAFVFTDFDGKPKIVGQKVQRMVRNISIRLLLQVYHARRIILWNLAFRS